MVFSSIYFTFLFLPLVLMLYFLAKENYRNYILLIASLIFYAYGEPKFVVVMIAYIIINYLMALMVDKSSTNIIKNIFLLGTIFINLLGLYIFKYLDFSIDVINYVFKTKLTIFNIALPIGISFFTFQAMSYVIDVYRGSTKVQKNPFYVALYISFFPQLVAGPIVRYNTIEQQIIKRENNLGKFGEGVSRFICGFSKKVILANNLAMIAEPVFLINDFRTVSMLYMWLGSISYSLQIYYDFSGYSDMAIGLGKMFGFDFEENFNYPYISKSITEFWRRWHISLSTFFRDYVYIPLGGGRKGIKRQFFNLFIVWSLTGIWHGANRTFLVWGMVYFIFLVLEKFFIKPEKRKKWFKFIYMICTLLLVNFQWIIFNSSSIGNAIDFIKSMFGYYSNPIGVYDGKVLQLLREYGFFLVLGVIFSTPVAKYCTDYFCREKRKNLILGIILPIGYLLSFFWAISFLIIGTHNPFIYFNF